MPEKTDEKFQFLETRLRENQCALILGPELLFECKNSTFMKGFSAYMKDHGYDMRQYDGGFLDMRELKGMPRQQFFDEVRNFFSENRNPDLIEKILSLPFHLIISLSPDIALKQIGDELNFNIQHSFYHPGRSQEKIEEPTLERPLIYNLLGRADKNSSLIFSFDDLYNYLESIFHLFQLPDKLRLALSSVNYFILLGCGYDKWYFSLLFKLLMTREGSRLDSSSRDDLISAQAYSKSEIINENLRSFYKGNFQIDFVGSNPDAFITELYDHFQKKEQSSSAKLEPYQRLRRPVPKETSLRNTMMKLMEENRFEEAILKAKKTEPNETKWSGLLGRLSGINQSTTITGTEKLAQLDLLREAIIAILNQKLV